MIEDDIKQVESYSELTQEKVLNIIKDVFSESFNKNDRIYQVCKINGLVARNVSNLNICNNPECTSCKEWNNTAKKLNLVK
jgi:hypothetical protein